ncbi:MAG: pilus assembly protein TadE [Actinomycetota bacterium]|nr:pilus assembly protein TadE [Actinomycetota bacterium]
MSRDLGGRRECQLARLLGDDRGAVTVEAALALCSLVAVMALVVASVAAASAHLRCLDAAREAARLVARGESDRAREVAAVVAPRGARVQVRVAGDQVEVEVSVAVVPGVPGLSLAAGAVAVLEPAALLTSELRKPP